MSVYEKIIRSNLEASHASYAAGMAAERDLGENARKLRRLRVAADEVSRLAEIYCPGAAPNFRGALTRLRVALRETAPDAIILANSEQNHV